MPNEFNAERQARDTQEVEELQKKMKADMVGYQRDYSDRRLNLKEIMALPEDDRRGAALDQLHFVAERVREYTGKDELRDYKKLTPLTLPAQGRDALEKTIAVFTRNNLVSQDEVNLILRATGLELFDKNFWESITDKYEQLDKDEEAFFTETAESIEELKEAA